MHQCGRVDGRPGGFTVQTCSHRTAQLLQQPLWRHPTGAFLFVFVVFFLPFALQVSPGSCLSDALRGQCFGVVIVGLFKLYIIIIIFFFPFFFFLVDPLEPLRVLHGHEEFLSQVFEWLVSGQIQTVETVEERNVWECDSFQETTQNQSRHFTYFVSCACVWLCRHTTCELLVIYLLSPTARLWTVEVH